jgi:dienelactone hydrolase
MADDGSLDGYVRFDFTDPHGRWTRPVFRRGAGPAVIVIHEMPGLHPLVTRFADRVASAGMCFTGGFALAMMTEPAMVAPVLSQPSPPLPAGSRRRAGAVDASPAEIACAKRRFEEEDLSMIGLRFLGDPFVPDARFASLKSVFGARFEAIEIDPKFARSDPRMAPHSVLTLHLDDRDPAGPTKRAEERVIAFFKERTGA